MKKKKNEKESDMEVSKTVCSVDGCKVKVDQ